MGTAPGTPAPEETAAGRLFRTKSLDHILQEAEQPQYQLKRALGPLQLTLIGIGAIIGAGIFATIGTAAAGDEHRPGAGPALVVSFLLTAIACGFAALCYAEFAAMVPISGSAYTYSYATLGEFIAWIIGWDLIIEYAVGNIAVAISWADYFKELLAGIHIRWLNLAPEGILIPDWLSTDYRTAAGKDLLASAPHLLGVPIVFNLPAVAIVALITLILVWGVRESARFNAVMVGIKIVVLTFFIVVGCTWLQPANWRPFMPNGWAGVSAGAAIVFFAYIGFDAVSTVAEETQNPQRNLPIGIIASLVICTVFYIVVSAVFTGLLSYPELRTKTPEELAQALTMALKHVDPTATWTVGIVALGSVIAHTAVLLVYQLGQPRIFFSMARDGLLPPLFSRVHPRFRTPHVSTIVTGVFVAGIAAFASIDEMVDLTNIGTLFAFILVCIGIIVLRVKEPDRPRPFRVPGGLVLPILGILSCLYLVYYLPTTSWLRFTAWLNFGFVIYVGYGAVHSRLTGRQHSASPVEHDIHTASTGAWLGLIGAGLLLVMRGLEVWLVALDQHQDVGSGLARARVALGDVFSVEPWLEVSWFLLVPLAVNALVLSPIIIYRALRVRRIIGIHRRGAVMPALMAASGLTAISLVYFCLVAVHHRGAAL